MAHLEKDPADLHPIFCLKTKDLRTSKKLFVNFKATSQIEYPKLDLSAAQLRDYIINNKGDIEDYKIPMVIGQIFWTRDNKGQKSYVIDVRLNDKYASQRVLRSVDIQDFVIKVTLLTIEEKYNDYNLNHSRGQFLGHELEIKYADSKNILKNKKLQEKGALVQNKVYCPEDADGPLPDEQDDANYSVYYIPASNKLELNYKIDEEPTTISFNEDTVQVKSNKEMISFSTPINIDIRKDPVWFYSWKKAIFRCTFSTIPNQ